MSITAQARWARKKKKQGKCSRCGQPRNRYAQLCDKHQAEFTTYMRTWRKRNRQEENHDNQRPSSQSA